MPACQQRRVVVRRPRRVVTVHDWCWCTRHWHHWGNAWHLAAAHLTHSCTPRSPSPLSLSALRAPITATTTTTTTSSSSSRQMSIADFDSAVQLTMVVFIVEQNLVGILFESGLLMFYHHLGINMIHHTATHTLEFCPGLPGWADTRKVKPGR